MECPVCHGTQVQVYGSTLVRCRVRDCEGHAWHTLDAWRLRALEDWIVEHAQHGGSCPYWGPYEETDRQQCTCGLAEIMEEMK